MPIYEYHCQKCGHEFEVLQKHFDVDEMPCEKCGSTAKRMMSNTSFVLKGTGWYVTDYKSNGGCSAAGGNGKTHHADKSSTTETTPCASAGSTGGCPSCAGSTSTASGPSTTSASSGSASS